MTNSLYEAPAGEGGADGADGRDDVVRLTAVRKVYGGARSAVVALDGVSVGLRRGTFTAIMGPSG
ncbi:ABC transporter ATP-binding protein, partial [Spirillospora sp. NPDC047418]